MTHPPPPSPPPPAAADRAAAPPTRTIATLWLMLGAIILAAGPFLVLGPRLTWITVSVLAALALLGWMADRTRQPVAAPPVLALWSALAMGLLVGAGSLAWTPVPGNAARALLDLALLAIGYGVLDRAIAGLSARALKRLGALVLVAMAAMAATSAVELLSNQAIYRAVNDLAADITLSDATLNRAAVACVALSFAAARLAPILLHHRPPALRTLAGGLALAIGAWLAFSSPSQSAQAGMVAGLLAWAAAVLVGRRAVLGTLAAVAVTAAVAAIPIAGQLYANGLSEAPVLPTSAQHRVEIWHFAAERAGERPILGHGFDASRHLANEDDVSAFQEAGQSVIPLHPHSLILQIWLELGLVGIAVLLAVIFAVGRRLWQSRRADGADIALAAALLTMLNVAYGAWQAWWLSAIILAVLVVTLGGRLAQGEHPSR